MKKKTNDKIGNFGTLLAELPKSIDCLFAWYISFNFNLISLQMYAYDFYMPSLMSYFEDERTKDNLKNVNLLVRIKLFQL